MSEIIEKVVEDVVVEEDLTTLDETTDWKAKANEIEQKRREDGIRSRERTKVLKAKLAELESAKPTEKVENKKSDELLLEKLEKVTLRSEGITHPDDVELARKTAQKWGMDVDEVVADEDFKAKLGRQQTARANVAATSGVKGGTGGSDVKLSSEYWNAKGVPPTKEQVPDRKVRVKILREMMAGAKTSGKKFYND